MHLVLARFLIGLVFNIGSVFCFIEDHIVAAVILLVIGLFIWGLGELIGEIADLGD